MIFPGNLSSAYLFDGINDQITFQVAISKERDLYKSGDFVHVQNEKITMANNNIFNFFI